MRSKTPLALMEQVIMVLVFALAAALCLRAFVLSDHTSRACEERDRAVMAAETVAEALKLCRGDYAEAERMAEAVLENTDVVLCSSVAFDPTGSPGLSVAVIPTDSGTPRMGCATVTAFNPKGESIFSLPIAWQEVSGND